MTDEQHVSLERWDEWAESWDSAPTIAYADEAFASLERQLPAMQLTLIGARVLDFGCGTGLLTERLAAEGATVAALDPSQGMIDALERKVASGLEGVTPVLGDLDTTAAHPAFEAPFDLVVASSVCAFLPDYPGAVAALAGLLRSGGHVVQWDWEWRETDEEPFGLTADRIRDALSAAGLEAIVVKTAFRRAFDGKVMDPLMGVGRTR